MIAIGYVPSQPIAEALQDWINRAMADGIKVGDTTKTTMGDAIDYYIVLGLDAERKSRPAHARKQKVRARRK